MSTQKTPESEVKKWDMESGSHTEPPNPVPQIPAFERMSSRASLTRATRNNTIDEEQSLTERRNENNLNYLMHPIATINETKDVLQKLGTVHMVPKRMKFSDDVFERRYIDYIEKRLRSRMFLLGIIAAAYGLYSLFFYNFFGSKESDPDMPKHQPLVYSWATSANILYNIMWISTVLFGLVTVVISIKKNMFRHSVERYLQYAVVSIIIAGMLFGNLWRVSRLTGVPFYQAFPGSSDTYPDSDLVMLLGCIILYLAVVADMRFRRLVWIALIALLIYSVTVVFFGLPDFKQTAFDIAQAGNARVSEEATRNTRNLYTAAALTRSLAADQAQVMSTLDVKASTDNIQPWMLVTQLLAILGIGLFGKVQLELLQRQNFLELELAQKRIDVLEKTINAIDNDNQPHNQIEKTHRRLKEAEKIIQKVKLIGLSSSSTADGMTGGSAVMNELQIVLDVLKDTEKTMSILDFQKEVLLGPIKTGHEYKEEEVMNWIQTVINNPVVASDGSGLARTVTSGSSAGTAPVSAVYGHHPILTPTSSTSGPIIPLTAFTTENDLGISAKSLMKRIGIDWNLNMYELEQTLSSNRATDLSAFQLTVRAVLLPYLNNVLLGVPAEIIYGFGRGMNDGYLDVPYHNAYHAAMVCNQAVVLMEITGIKKNLTGIDRLAVAIAALGHNVSHFGRSNSFLVDTRHDLAVRYNDTSVLENFFAAKTFEIIRSSRVTNITCSMSKKDEKRFRNRVIQLILSTDSGQHFELFSEFKSRMSSGSRMFQDSSVMESDRRIGSIAIMKAADLGHHAVLEEYHVIWMEKLAEEFALQGDDERSLGIPISPMCDREAQDVPNMALSLMSLMVMPMYDELYNLVKKHNPVAEGKMGNICSALVNNHLYWESERRKSKRERQIRLENTPFGMESIVEGKRQHFDSFDFFIPVPKDSAPPGGYADSSSGMENDGPESPPMLIPVREDIPNSPISELVISPINSTIGLVGATPSLNISAQQSGSSDEDDDEDGPPMLPFNQAFR